MSHRKKFIFLKTRKTAGTSIEIYLEPYCLPPDEPYVVTPARQETITPAGIIGRRGRKTDNTKYYNHIAAKKLQALVGETVWDSYLKVSCVRNPFDRLVSLFWFVLPKESRGRLENASLDELQTTFSRWILDSKRGSMTDILAINGKLAVDKVIHYESLLPDLEMVCAQLGIPFKPERLGRYKSAARKNPAPYSAYYDDKSIALVRKLCRFEFDRFGYSLTP